MTTFRKTVPCILWTLLTFLSLSTPAAAQEDKEAGASKVREELAAAIDTYHDTCEAAEGVLRSVLDGEIETIKKSLRLEERLQQRASLEGQLDAFLKDAAEPENKALRKASTQFHKSVQAAAEACFKAHTDAANKLDKIIGLDAATEVLNDRHELLVASAYWLPPIPNYVKANIEALRDHRPAFIATFLEKELGAVAKAAKGKDRLRFRRAIDDAIAATKASVKAGEPAGNPNCRADIVLVLETIRAGEWDLRSLEVHYRDHRKKKKHQGLPGVEYR